MTQPRAAYKLKVWKQYDIKLNKLLKHFQNRPLVGQQGIFPELKSHQFLFIRTNIGKELKNLELTLNYKLEKSVLKQL